ncbi:hypothetical protein TL16_g07634, partial [Triparma laevis f. inornata]
MFSPSSILQKLKNSSKSSNRILSKKSALLPSTIPRSDDYQLNPENKFAGDYIPPIDSTPSIEISITSSISVLTSDEIPLTSAPLTLLLTLVQTILTIIPFITCPIAPIKINPMLGPYPTTMDAWGAKNAYKMVEDGEWGRLITPIFLHAGIIHLLSNIVIQLDQVKQYEYEWGSPLLLVIYLLTGIFGNLLSSVFKPGVLGVGASGAIMGILGARIGEGLVKYYDRDGGIVDLTDTICAVVIVMGLSFVPFVDWPAHLGGAVSGLFLGIILFSWFSRKRRAKWKCFSIIVGVGTFLGVSTCISMLFLVDWEQYKELDDVCSHYEEYYAQFGEDFVCECDGNRAADWYNKYSNNDDNGDNF